MPVSVVVGGQYGSEGKGKVALALARRERGECVAVRVGGPNSGHTGYDLQGRRWILRQLPVAAVDGVHMIVLPAGSYIDPDLLLKEIASLGLSDRDVAISPRARVITADHVRHEHESRINDSIGSTATGTGAAVVAAIQRNAPHSGPVAVFANDDDRLRRYVRSTADLFRKALSEGRRVIVEGTQGFGLSPLHSPYWPNVTSRDTTAAAFLAEAGLAPTEVDDVTLVARCWPIRVSGNSGPLETETDWETVTRECGAPSDLREFTSVTKKLRRIGRFEFEIVKQAIAVNQPTRLVLNHLDHIDWRCRDDALTRSAWEFIHYVERGLARHVDWVGTGVDSFVELRQAVALRA
jgi:adenylosuccinate synthase